MKVICVFFNQPNFNIKAFAEGCYRISPDIALRGSDAVFIDISRCLTLYQEQGAVLRVKALLNKFNLKASVAMAEHVPVALCLAESRKADIGQLSLEYLKFFADPFAQNSEDDFAAIEKMIEALHALHIQNLGEFAGLPRRSLTPRFGALAKTCWDRVVNPAFASALLWPKFRPDEILCESEDLMEDERCATLEPLLFKSKTLLERLAARMRGRSRLVTSLNLELQLDFHSAVKEPVRSFKLNLLMPQGSSRGLLSILQERLSFELSRKPLESEVKRIIFTVLETAPNKNAQTKLFEKASEQEELLSTLVGRIAEKIGAENIFKARLAEHYLPEKSWFKARVGLNAPSSEVSAVSGRRPLRLFDPPQPFWGAIPVIQMRPERITTQWWGELCARDYFEVEVSNKTCWIFKDQHGKWFLHGIFE